jgi:hypothetical protein
MTFEVFVPQKPYAATMAVIGHANDIISEYARQGFVLTPRQLYYQFVARSLFKENTMAKYKKLCRIICNGRDAGLVDWDAIEDRTREVHTHSASRPIPIRKIGGRRRPIARKCGSRKMPCSGSLRGFALSFAFPTSLIAATIRKPYSTRRVSALPNMWDKV